MLEDLDKPAECGYGRCGGYTNYKGTLFKAPTVLQALQHYTQALAFRDLLLERIQTQPSSNAP